MKRWALIQGNTIATVVEQDSKPSIEGRWVELSGAYGPGDFFDGSTFSHGPAAADITQWLIDVGPFFDRFESAKFSVLTSTNVGVQAVVKDAQTRKWIDLKHPAVAQGIDVVIGASIPGVDVALKSRILNTPVSEAENFALRKVYFGG